MYLKEHRRAQISMEYVVGFLFFIIALLFVVFSVLDKLPQYYDESHNTLLHESAWFASQKAMSYASVGGTLNFSAVNEFSNCDIYTRHYPGSDEFTNGVGNYTHLKSVFGLDDVHGFRMSVKSFSILMHNESSGTNYTGPFNIDGTTGLFEIFNYTDEIYDGIHIGSSYSKENDIVTIASQDYAVGKIDPSGNFVILSKTLVECGKHTLIGMTTASVKRYTTYNGSIAIVEMILWA
ncbi:MAG: hypothetical protein KAJ91_01590 [Candidatus Aenigmarchaeota archaeon]|nr:hypothetical protein [Candidatus Aenigmarchaeota archaeon]